MTLIEKFLFKDGHKPDSSLFRKICYTKGDFSLHRKKIILYQSSGKSESYAQKYWPRSLTIWLSSYEIGRGGASLATAIGIHDHLIMRHGGEIQNLPRVRYTKKAKESLLSVSKALRL